MKLQKHGRKAAEQMRRCVAALLSGCMVLTSVAVFPAAEVKAEDAKSGKTAETAPLTVTPDTVSWVMSQENNYWQDKGTLETTEWNDADKGDLYIDIDENITYQEMAEHAWGGCFNERGWKYLNRLPEEKKERILDLLFDPNEPEGLHITMGRIPIGASDFGNDLYTLDETVDDYELNDFSIERDKSESGIIPFIKEALKRQPDMKFWASPWSPPSWMKENNALIGGKIEYTEENMAAYAKYFKKFVEAYRAEGIEISMVSPQNEPTMNTAYTSCVWTGEQLRDFIRDHLGPEMEKLGVEIYLGTFTNSSDKLMDPLLSDAEARKYISGITFQWWSYIKAHSLYESGFELGMMQSETMCGDGNNNWQYAENQFDITWSYLSAGINAYNLWNMVLEWNGTDRGGHNTAANPWPQNAPITVNGVKEDEHYDNYRINPQYYQYKHFTNYIQPGARRIESSGTYDAAYPVRSFNEVDGSYTDELHEIAFRNPDGTNVLILKNGSNEDKNIKINFNGRGIAVTIPAHSINSFQTKGTPLTGEETDMTRQNGIAEKIVKIENKATGHVLCINNSGTEGNGGAVANMSQIFLWTYGGEGNQQWYMEPVDGAENTVKLINIKSFKAVAVDGGSTASGAKLILWPSDGGTDKNWVMEDAGDGYYRFKNVNSGMYLSGAAGAQATQETGNASSDNQKWQITYLDKISDTDVTELKTLADVIAQADALTESEYTQTSWQKLSRALAAAKAVDKTSKIAVNRAVKDLKDAIGSLELAAAADVDKSALITAIQNAETFMASKESSDYTQESWSALENALIEANKAKNSNSVSQSRVDAAKAALEAAQQGLAAETADKSGLNTLIQESETRKQTDYTQESWGAFDTALKEAKAVAADTSALRSQVNAAEKKLRNAKKALVPTAADAAKVSWVMSQEGSYWQDKGTLTAAKWDEGDRGDLYIEVDEDTTYQKMAENVWGGCFNERGWKYLNKLPEADKEKILDLLFDPDEPDGLHITMGRIPIGASDFAIDPYSLDETEGDYELKDFSIERDKKADTGIIPFIKEALKRQPNMKFWASPWTPPSWIKTSKKLTGSGDGNPEPRIEYTEENMEFYAKYFRKFVEAYRAEGINISMVSPQNEPTMNTAYTSCVWTGQQLCDFIRDHLGPEMKKLGVEVYLGTFTESSDNMMDPTLNDPEARQYLSGITFQWWSYVKARSLYNSGFELGMMQSETMCGDGNNTWTYAEEQFDLMWLYLSNGINAYNLWNMVLEWDGKKPGGYNTAKNPWPQNAPITVNGDDKAASYDGYTINPHFYGYKHFTNYIEPGARRIESSGTYDGIFNPNLLNNDGVNYTSELHEIAFRNPDGTNVLLLKNGSNKAKQVDINFNGQWISVEIPAHSINSFKTAGTPLTGNETDMTETIPVEEVTEIGTKADTSQRLCSIGSGGVANDNAIVGQWDINNEANQQWYLEPVVGADNPRTVKLVNIKSLKVAAVRDGSMNAGAVTVLRPDTGAEEQQWILEEVTKDGKTYYRFKNVKSGLYLASERHADKGATQKAGNEEDDTQLWIITYVDRISEDSAEVKNLESSASAAQALTKDDYTPESYAAVEAALDAYENVDKTSKNAVNRVIKALKDAMNALEPTDSAKTDETYRQNELGESIADGASKKKDDYEAESWSVYQSALIQAETILNNPAATKSQVAKAKAALEQAAKDLRVVTANKSGLANAVTDAESRRQGDYTEESWQIFKAALENAKTINEKESALKSEVEEAKKALEKAVAGLSPVKADKSNLEQAITEAESKKQASYTPATWSKLQEALQAARNVNQETSPLKSEVDAAEQSLRAAISGLVEVQNNIGKPVAPANVKAAWSGAKTVKLTWNKSADAVSYDVYRSNAKTKGYKKIASDIKGTSYTDKKATAGKNAYYKVIAKNSAGESAYSNVASVYILKAPAKLKAKAAKGKVTISFGKVSKASGYEIYRSTKKNGKYKKAATLKSQKTVKKSLKLKKGTYYFKVRAYKKVGKKPVYTDYTKPVKVKVK